MLQTILNAPWQQAYDVLASGNPPIIMRVLAINTLFFVLFMVRRVRGVHVMTTYTAIAVQSMLIAANLLMLYQDTIEQLLRKVI